MKKTTPTPMYKFQVDYTGHLYCDGYPVIMMGKRSFTINYGADCSCSERDVWIELQTPLYLVEAPARGTANPVYKLGRDLFIEAVPMRTRCTGRGSGAYRSKIHEVTAGPFIVDVKTYLSWGPSWQKREFIKACVKIGVFPSHSFLKGHYGRAKRRDEQRLNATMGFGFFDLED
jgi:hypothetical protein